MFAQYTSHLLQLIDLSKQIHQHLLQLSQQLVLAYLRGKVKALKKLIGVLSKHYSLAVKIVL